MKESISWIFVYTYFLTGVAFEKPRSFFEEPCSVIFEEVKYDVYDGCD